MMADKPWQPIGKVEELFIYPVKSCRGSKVEKATVTKLGLEENGMTDRRFMFADNTGKFTSSRVHPKIVLITCKVEDNKLILNAPDMPTLTVTPPSDDPKLKIKCSVWGEAVSGLDCGDRAAEWITKYTGSPLRLIHSPWKTTDRILVKFPFTPLHQKDDVVAYPDYGPVNILSAGSIADLNSKLTEKLTVRNFRPNILMSGCKPYEEDDWKYIKINEATFRNVVPCTRCKFTTLNPDTAEFSKEYEPMTTLRTYRLCEDPEEKKEFKLAPKFGRMLGVDKQGVISVGDTVFACNHV